MGLYREVTRYETSDGHVHETEERAQRHARDLLCGAVEKFLNEFMRNGHRPSVIQAVDLIIENRLTARDQLRDILEMLEQGDGQ